MLSREISQIQNILPIKYDQFLLIFGVSCPVRYRLIFLVVRKKLHFRCLEITSVIIIIFIKLVIMSIKHRSSQSNIQIQAWNRNNKQSVQFQLLNHKIKALEAKLVQQSTIIDTLKFHNEDLDRQLFHKNDIIQKLKQQNSQLKKVNVDLQQQLLARKKSGQEIIRQIRQQNSIIKQKNIKMCQIVNFLQHQLEQLKIKALENQTLQSGLRKRVQQLTVENQNIRKRMAKSQVESQKYKLKALEGQKYWSSKLEKSKMKQHQQFLEKNYNLQVKHKQQIIMLKSDIFRIQKILKIKEEQIKSLQDKIQQMLIQRQ